MDEFDFDSGYNDNYVYTPEDLDTSNQYTPSQNIDDFLSGQGNYQIDGTYFGQDQDWGNLNWGDNHFGNDDPWDPMAFAGQGFQTPAPQDWLQNQASLTQQLPQQGGIEQALASIFNLKNSGGLLGKGIAALFEGSQNKRMAKDLRKIAQNPALDPFGSQRPFYQQELQRAVTNPYDSPMVRSQVENMQRMQDIKDAAAGRRSNQLSSAPGVLAQQAEIAQRYMNSLQTPAGANIAPKGETIASLLQGGAKYDANGYISPLANVFGYGNRQSNIESQLAEALQKLTASRG